MRDIKFRAWDSVNNEMLYNVGLDYHEVEKTSKPVKKGYQWFSAENTIYNAQPMQYTGLKDKEGNEIYEGDIVKGLVMFQNNLMEVKGVVKFIHGRFVIAEYNCSLYEFANIPTKKSNEIVVIGNKYENPELLGGE